MARTRLFETGLEANDSNEEHLYLLSIAATYTISISNSVYRSGGYGLFARRSSLSALGGAEWTPLQDLTQFVVSFHFKTTTPFGIGIFSTLDSSNNTLHSVRLNAGPIGIGLWNGSSQVGSYATITGDTWYHVALDCKISATDGWLYLYLDGVLVASMTGNTGSTAVDSLLFGNTTAASADNSGVYYDDIYVDNTVGETESIPPADLRFPHILRPSSVGDYSEMDPSSAVDHYTLVDEVSSSSSDYVSSNAPGEKESYGVGPTYTLPDGVQVSAICPIAICYNPSTLDVELKMGNRLTGAPGVNQLGNAQLLDNQNYVWIFDRFPLNPNGDIWSEDDVNNHQFLMESAGTYT